MCRSPGSANRNCNRQGWSSCRRGRAMR
jgi:hypothetical protein